MDFCLYLYSIIYYAINAGVPIDLIGIIKIINMIISVAFIFNIFTLLLICKAISCNVDTALEQSDIRLSEEIDPHSFHYNKLSEQLCTKSRENADQFEHSNKDIDPHSLYYNKHTQKLYTQFETQLSETVENTEEIGFLKKCNQVFNDCLNSQLKDIPEEPFSRRLVNILLSSVNFEENDNLITGHIMIEITSSELKKLRNFGLGKAAISDVDPFIASIFKVVEKSSFDNTFTLIRNLGMYLLIHKEMVLMTTIVLYIVWTLWTTRWNIFKFIQISMLMIFVSSFIITYLQLLKKEEIKLTAKQMQFSEFPIQCRPDLMTWWEKLWHMYDSYAHCQKYYEAREENHFFHVTPAQALSHMFTTFFCHPAGLLGDAISRFVDQSTQHFWGPIQVIIAPLMTLVVMVLLIVALICIAGGSCGWGIGPFTIFSLRGSQRSEQARPISSKEKREPIEVILNLKVSSSEQTQQIALGPTREANSSETSLTNRESPKQIEDIDKNEVNIEQRNAMNDENKEINENLNLGSGDADLSKDAAFKCNCVDKNDEVHEAVKIISGSGDN